MNKFDKLFNPQKSSLHLTKIYFTNCDKVSNEEKNDLMDAYFRASDIAEKREFKEADQGIFH